MRKVRSDKVLSNREEMAINRLRTEFGFTIKECQNVFGVSKDVVVNASPARKAYFNSYYKSLKW